MASSTIQRTGSCLCGAIQLKITGEPVFTNLCHCSSCQKFSGTIFASIAAYKPEQLEYILSTPDAMKTYVDGSPESGRFLERSFCGTCSSAVRNRAPQFSGTAAVPTGIIDGDRSDLKPKMELFCASREGWLGEFEGTKKFAGMPAM